MRRPARSLSARRACRRWRPTRMPPLAPNALHGSRGCQKGWVMSHAFVCVCVKHGGSRQPRGLKCSSTQRHQSSLGRPSGRATCDRAFFGAQRQIQIRSRDTHTTIHGNQAYQRARAPSRPRTVRQRATRASRASFTRAHATFHSATEQTRTDPNQRARATDAAPVCQTVSGSAPVGAHARSSRPFAVSGRFQITGRRSSCVTDAKFGAAKRHVGTYRHDDVDDGSSDADRRRRQEGDAGGGDGRR
jgi:hypothetical protein